MAREIDEAWIDEAIERYRRIDVVAGRVRQGGRGLEVTVRSPDDSVEVLVTAAGEITRRTRLGSLHGPHRPDLARRCRQWSPPRPTPLAGPGRSCMRRRSATTARSRADEMEHLYGLAASLDATADAIAEAAAGLPDPDPSSGPDRPGPDRMGRWTA